MWSKVKIEYKNLGTPESVTMRGYFPYWVLASWVLVSLVSIILMVTDWINWKQESNLLQNSSEILNSSKSEQTPLSRVFTLDPIILHATEKGGKDEKEKEAKKNGVLNER